MRHMQQAFLALASFLKKYLLVCTPLEKHSVSKELQYLEIMSSASI